MKTVISNFVGSEHLEVEYRKGVSEFNSCVPNTVMLRQCSGSMWFQFNMLPEEARRMANALLGAVHEAEQAAQVAE